VQAGHRRLQWTLRRSYEILIFQTAVQKQDAASNRKVRMMLRTVFATVFLTGLNVTMCLAGEACPAADGYIDAKAKIGDRDLATAIACLAEKLPDEGAQLTPTDIHMVDQIQLLASKIIGNGAAAEAPSASDSAMIAAATVESPKPELAPVSSGNTLDAMAIACEADKLLEKMQPGKTPNAKLGTCSDPAGTKDAIKKYASKIIGNG
jgi:hypothetical protein